MAGDALPSLPPSYNQSAATTDQQRVEFLSCDSAFVELPGGKSMNLPSLADHFQTDRMPKFQRRSPSAPFPLSLCGCRVQIVSLIGCIIFCLLIVAIAAFVYVWMGQRWEHLENPAKSVVFLSGTLLAIIISGVCFVVGTVRKIHRLMLPFIFVAFVCLFAQIGVIAVLLLTLYSEAQETEMTLIYCIVSRVLPLIFVVIEAYFIVCHIRSYLYHRRTAQNYH